MRVVIAQVHENVFDGEAESLSIPTTDGHVTILPKHEPFVSNLKKGTAIVRTKSGEEKFTIQGGVLEVSSNQVTVIL